MASGPLARRSSPVLLGQNAGFLALTGRLEAVARVQRTTLILGPTGSGKDVVARYLHAHSERRSQPFVPVQCSSLPDTLAEAELFGHTRGAFTGATQSRPGLVRSARQGTLFLDEIDSLTAAAQAKLLRFLETGEFRALGQDAVEYSDSWVIAASNQDLRQRVAEGRFRQDLLYRLEVVKLEVPPLRQRGDDVLVLARHFLGEMDGAIPKRFSEGAERALLSHDWPGNIRELRHRVETAALFTEEEIIEAAALGLPGPSEAYYPHFDPAAMGLRAPDPDRSRLPEESPLDRELWSLVEGSGLSLDQALGLCEKSLLQAALRASGNNRTRAARRLGINVRTLYKKLPL